MRQVNSRFDFRLSFYTRVTPLSDTWLADPLTTRQSSSGFQSQERVSGTVFLLGIGFFPMPGGITSPPSSCTAASGVEMLGEDGALFAAERSRHLQADQPAAVRLLRCVLDLSGNSPVFCCQLEMDCQISAGVHGLAHQKAYTLAGKVTYQGLVTAARGRVHEPDTRPLFARSPDRPPPAVLVVFGCRAHALRNSQAWIVEHDCFRASH
jgi:hypothetical protein